MKVRLRWVPTGQLLCREGDPPGPLYLICAGLMRVYRRDTQPPHADVDLARVGNGNVIGELAPILKQPRSASVQALEPTQVLEIDVGEIGSVMEQQAALRRVVGVALKERSGLSEAAIASVAAKLGIDLGTPASRPHSSPTTALASSEPASTTAVTFPEPAHDTTLVYPKALTCPACGAQFSALVVRPKKDMPGERSTDFHQSYRTSLNPYDYELWVCPNDLYAALPADFADLSSRQQAQVAETVEQVIQGWGDVRPDFNVDRTLQLREQALLLALELYRMRQAPPLRLAAIQHRLAWCARERGDRAAEHDWLSQAIDSYATGYREAALDAREEIRILYLCGELSMRLGSIADAQQWFSQGLRHAALKDHPTWDRMIRQQWTLAREVAATGAAASAA